MSLGAEQPKEGVKPVKVGCFPGQTTQTLMVEAKEQFYMSTHGGHVVVIAVGLNIIPKGEDAKLVQGAPKG